jgi:hypothetical protein
MEKAARGVACKVEIADRKTAIGNPYLSMPCSLPVLAAAATGGQGQSRPACMLTAGLRRKPGPSVAEAPLTFTSCTRPMGSST